MGSLTALKDLLNRLGTETLCTEEIFPMEASGTDLRSNYLLNSTIAGVEDADFALLIGCNPRFDAPVFNARLRKCWIHNELNVAMVGPKVDLTYDYDHIGETTEVLAQLADGSHPYCARLAKAKNPIVIVGSEALQREDGASVMAHVQRIASNLRQSSGCAEDWKIIRVVSEVVDEKLPYDKLPELRARMAEVAPNLIRYGNIEPANFFVQSLNLANEMSQQLSGKPL